jgi:alkanesulfonate monooxygenase SsuD/methylene tetrahydromethanopterin reductase-like flavin-dependent oxidoreductase (luciferase family)
LYISIFLGPFSAGAHEDVPLIDLCIEQAVDAANSGFCMVTFGEQHFNNYEPYCNPFMMGAHLASQLEDAYFATTITPLPLHQPLRLAENINLLDVLTRGKLIIGLSAGRVAPGFRDFENFGLNPRDRDAIFDSKLELLLRALRQEAGNPPVEMDTQWDKGALHGRMMPISWRERPILAIGTNTDRTIVETARRGWPLFLGPCSSQEAGRKFAIYRAALAEAGHDAKQQAECLARSLVARHVIVGESEDEAWEAAELMMGRNPLLRQIAGGMSYREFVQAARADAFAGDPRKHGIASLIAATICGTPQTVLRDINELESLGVRHLHARFTVGTYHPEPIGRSYRLFRDEVMPKLHIEKFAPPSLDELRAEHRTHRQSGQASSIG